MDDEAYAIAVQMDDDNISCPSLIDSDPESDNEVSNNYHDYPDSLDEDDLCAVELSWPGAMRAPKTIIMTIHEDGYRTILATSWENAESPILDDNPATEPDMTLGMAELDDFEVMESIY